jgi:SAM-dependent methyltransferase
MAADRDYVLGTHADELVRLGLQHRVWRSVVLNCWRRAGITVGRRVLDVGAGPGYATIDLAEIVGPTGQVVAVERSHNFIEALNNSVQSRSLNNVRVHELDLMTDPLPEGQFDFSWCRWVIAFVADPAAVIKKLASALRPGGKAIFHEYGRYETWRFFPLLESQEHFRRQVVAAWRESGGEPDAGAILPGILAQNGLVIRSVRPHVFCIWPNDYMWQWPKTFIEVYLPRLVEQQRVDQRFADEFRADFAAAEKDSNTFMVTPLVIEIIAERVAQPRPSRALI